MPSVLTFFGDTYQPMQDLPNTKHDTHATKKAVQNSVTERDLPADKQY